MSGQHKPMHALTILHVVAMAAVVIWWALYFWRHTPARELLRRTSPPPASQHRRPVRGVLPERAAGEFGRSTQSAAVAIALAAADVAGGLVVVSLFAIGTGIYVRRLEVWLQARGSGETMAFAGTGLDDKALAANMAQVGKP